jgi:hypothetical protein
MSIFNSFLLNWNGKHAWGRLFRVDRENCWHEVKGAKEVKEMEIKLVEKKVNPNTHLFLYAKYQYQRGNIWNDLKKIVGKKLLIYSYLVSDIDVVNVLLEVAINQIILMGEPKDPFLDFIVHLHPENRWEIGGNSEESFNMGVIRKCLSILKHTELKYISDLGKPDPDILPLMPL